MGLRVARRGRSYRLEVGGSASEEETIWIAREGSLTVRLLPARREFVEEERTGLGCLAFVPFPFLEHLARTAERVAFRELGGAVVDGRACTKIAVTKNDEPVSWRLYAATDLNNLTGA